MSSSQAQKPKFSAAIQTETYQRLIKTTLMDPKRAARFTAAITSAVAVNPALQGCDPGTILSCGFLGEALELSPSPQLGFYYMIPFEDRKNGRVAAVFVLGYRGLLQLAARSGQYKDITVSPVKKGELVKHNRITGEIELNPIEGDLEWETAETAGYYASFEYINGFKKSLYWSREKMMRHADQYSKAFSAASYEKLKAGLIPEKDQWKYSSFWYKDFDQMAQKTMIRQLLSKWGLLSPELRTAIESDSSVISPDLAPETVIPDFWGTLPERPGEDFPPAASGAPGAGAEPAGSVVSMAEL
jgi:recombination protein RecT